MSLREEQSLFVQDLIALINYAWQLGYDVVIGEVQRPLEMQKIYVQTGRSKTMRSNHIRKCAADLHFFWRPTGELRYPQELGDYWESLHPKNRWGGNWKSFKDGPHFERHEVPR